MTLGKRPRRDRATDMPPFEGMWVDDLDIDEGHESDRDWDEKPSRKTVTGKRRKRERNVAGASGPAAVATPAKQTGRRRKTGKLAALMEMPMDIFVEIAYHLHPRDLLYLSRATKSFRKMFMSKESRMVWRASFENVNAPKNTDSLSEPLYAALLYDSYCMHCGDNAKCTANFTLCKRLCKQCTADTICYPQDFFRDFCEMVKKSGLETTFTHSSLYARMLWTAHKERPSREVYDGKSDSWPCYRYYRPELVPATQRLIEVAAEKPEKLNEYVKAESEAILRNEEHAIATAKWLRDEEEVRKAEHQSRLSKFLSDVKDKLKECGHTPDDFSKVEHSVSKSVRSAWKKQTEQPKELTAKVWERLRPKLEGLIERDRQHRYQLAAEKRRPFLKRLVLDRINSLETERKCSLPSHSECRAEYVFVDDIDKVECHAISAFMKLYEGTDALVNLKILPDDVWNKLVEDGILVKLDELRHYAEDVLKKCLVEGVTRIPNSALDVFNRQKTLPPVATVNLPSSFSVHHPAAFFHVDDGYTRSDFYSKRLGGVLTYTETLSLEHVWKRFESAEADWKRRSDMPGSNSVNDPQGWSKIRETRFNVYEGDLYAVRIALALLQDLGYGCEEAYTRESYEKRNEEDAVVGKNGKGDITMTDIMRKGDVFVCTRCPEEGRSRQTWKELVLHYHSAAADHDEALQKYKELLKKADVKAEDYYLLRNPPVNVHDVTTKRDIDEKLAVEDPLFINEHHRLYGKVGSQAHDRKLHICFKCKVCDEIKGTLNSVRFDHQRCLENHLKASHGIHQISDEVMEVLDRSTT